ncbi:MAG: 3-hydroxyacyl-CoA dehydrogenase family protein [Proteobacteria bacterium]|nr:3-hydroxyacyl-CoA dehydrogenase family protein [Pseudomonadota bacterium]
MTEKAKIGIIGAGLMGHGIAQVFTLAGHAVRITDVSKEALASVLTRIRKNLTDLGLDPACVDLVVPVADLETAVKNADVVFEAGPEDMAFKQNIFAEIEKYAPQHALLASNTSVMPITRIMEKVKQPRRALGTHWWNPPYLVPLVEVIRTETTSIESMDAMVKLLTSVGKTAVRVDKDVPGFIGNRLQHALWREAISLVEHGICSAEAVDAVVKASFGRRLAVLGPLENADLVGTELTLAIHQNVLPHIDHTPGPSPYLGALIDSGRLGMKSGEGFRKWSSEQQAELRAKVLAHLKMLNERGI